MQTRRMFLRSLSTAAVTGVVVGCGPKPPKIVLAKGILKIDGRPAADISIQFQPFGGVKSGGGPTSFAVTNEAGEFTLKTNDGRDGAVVGKHYVVLVDTKEDRPPQGGPPPKPPRIPPQFNAPSDALTAEVSESGELIALDVPSK